MTKQWRVRQIGSGEDVKVHVDADSREEAIERAQDETRFPWHIRKVTARPTREGEQDDRVELKWQDKKEKS